MKLLPWVAAIAAAPLFAQPAADIEVQLKKFVEAFAKVEANAADPVSSDQAIYSGAIPGMLRGLDPHSTFLDPQQTEQLKEMERSERKGFGSVVSVLPGRVIVLQTLPGTPSQKAGLSPGDEIVGINNIALYRLDFDQLIQLLTETRQHQAKIDVRRPGNARALQFLLTPELMDSPSVDRAFLLQPGIGYVRIANFDPQTGKLAKDAVEKLGGSQLKGLVLDLRNNPGGVVQAALETASLFLKPGQRILSVKGRSIQGENVDVPKNAEPYGFPLAVLVNEKTASAAEIVTGALQDDKRAAVIGEPTYGKGLVQSVFNLSGNTALALTTAFYYTPSGRSIQRPLKNVLLQSETSRNAGGVRPDEFVQPDAVTRLRAVLEGSGSFSAFGTDYLAKHKIDDSFQVSPDLLDDFRVFLSGRQIQPNLAEWLAHKDWIQARLQQEIVNLSLGVEKGDEIEMRHDPVVRRAISSIEASRG
jgi:carboxyl-terminal processing protease